MRFTSSIPGLRSSLILLSGPPSRKAVPSNDGSIANLSIPWWKPVIYMHNENMSSGIPLFYIILTNKRQIQVTLQKLFLPCHWNHYFLHPWVQNLKLQSLQRKVYWIQHFLTTKKKDKNYEQELRQHQNEIRNITLTVLFRSPKYRFVPEKPLSSIHFLINLNVPITEANKLEKKIMGEGFRSKQQGLRPL